MAKVTLVIDLDALNDELQVDPEAVVGLMGDLINSIKKIGHLNGIVCHNEDALGNFYEDTAYSSFQSQNSDECPVEDEEFVELEGVKSTLSESILYAKDVMMNENLGSGEIDFSSQMDSILLSERARSNKKNVEIPNRKHLKSDVSGRHISWHRAN